MSTLTHTDHRAVADLRSALSLIPAVASAHCKISDALVTVWVGIDQDSRDIREAVYGVEEFLGDRHPDLKINFRVIGLSHEAGTDDYVSAPLIYQRTAA